MGYAKHVGRVGALAVALGIGAAVATTPGVAWADDPPAQEDNTGGTADTPDTPDTSTETQDPGEAIRRNVERAANDLRDGLRTAIPGVVQSSGGAITSTHRTGSGASSGNVLSGASEPPKDEPQQTPFVANDNNVAPHSLTPRWGAPQVQVTTKPTPGAVAKKLDDAKQSAQQTFAAVTGSQQLPTGSTIGQRSAISTPDESSAEDQQPIRRPFVAPINIVTNVLNVALAPFINTTPNQPAPQNPVTWALLALARRQPPAKNQPPIVDDQRLTVAEGQTSDPTPIGGSDPNGDTLTYRVTDAPDHGTVTIDPATGIYTYTSLDGQDDQFTVTASDIGNAGFRLKGKAAAKHLDSGVVNVTVEDDEPTFNDGTVKDVKVGDIAPENEDEAIALDGQTATTPTGATVTYHYDPVTKILTADVNPSDANRLSGFLDPQQPSTFSSMRMASFAAAAPVAPTPSGQEEFDVVVGTQTLHVVVPVTAARLQTGAPITVGESPFGMVSSGNYLYVVNQVPVTDPVTFDQTYTVTVVDTSTNQPVKDIEVGQQPYGITSSGDRVYVVNLDQTVTVIDSTTNDAVDTFTLEGAPQASPFNIAASDDGTRLYIANNDGTVSVVDATTGDLIDAEPPTTTDPNDPEADVDLMTVGNYVYAVAVSGNRLYVTDPTTNTVKVMDIDESSPTFGEQIGAPIAVGGFPEDIATVRPPGATHDDVYVVNAQDNTISVIDTSTNQVVKTIAVASTPASVVGSPDGSLVYVGGAESMTVIDTATRTAILTTRTDTTPEGYPTIVALSSDGSRVYVSDALKVYDPAHGIFEYNNEVVPISFVTGGDLNAPVATVGPNPPVVDHGSGAVTTTLSADDADGDALSVSATQPANGTVTVTPNADGTYSVTYTPDGQARLDAFDAGVEQKDQFVVTVTDGQKTVTVPMEVTIDPAEVAVTDTFGSGAGLHLVRGMTVAPNGDVLITYMNIVSSPTVSLYNATTQTLVDDDIYTVDHVTINQYAEGVAVDENNLTYVANPATQTVDVYGVGGGAPTPVPVGGTPVGLFTNSDGSAVYALVRVDYDPDPNDGIDETRTKVSVFDVTNSIPVGDAYDTQFDFVTNDLTEGAMGKNGRIYVTNPGGTTVSVIDSANPTPPIEVGGTPISIDYNETTERTYVTVVKPSASDPNGYTVSVVDITSGSAVPVGDAYTVSNTAFPELAEQSAELSDMAVSPDGSHIYITNVVDSTVTVMKATGPDAGTIDQTVAVPRGFLSSGGGPLRIAFSPTGDHVYLVDQTGTFTELSFAQNAINV